MSAMKHPRIAGAIGGCLGEVSQFTLFIIFLKLFF